MSLLSLCSPPQRCVFRALHRAEPLWGAAAIAVSPHPWGGREWWGRWGVPKFLLTGSQKWETVKSQQLCEKKKEKTFWLVTWRCWSYMDCFGLSEPPPITEGVFVWHKLRSYPFWPALVGALLVMSCGVKSWLDHKISIIGKFCKQVSLFCNSAGEKCESQAEKSKRVVNWWLDTFQKQRVGNFLSFNSLNAQIVYVIAYQRNIASTVVLQSAHWPQH